jgi:hypothetical protein
MTIGIHKFRDVKQTNWITGMLLLPIKGEVSEYAINTRNWAAQETTNNDSEI